MLYGRIEEQAVIDRLLNQAKTGASGVLLLRGQPGIGKTALLEYAATSSGMRVLRGIGVESEAELPFAGLHLLFGQWLGRTARIPAPQRRALEGAFGLASVESGDRLLVGLAVLSLLAELAEDGPVLCVVDDAQWLDRASAEALLLAARRVRAEGVALIFAARDGEDAFPAPGLPELRLTGLNATEATELLDHQDTELTPAVRFRVLTEAGGNPLALLELPAAFALEPSGTGPRTLPLTTRLQAAFYGQVRKLPAATRTLLLVAAEDNGELDLVLRSAATLGIDLADLVPAEQAGLIRLADNVVTFRHPLVRAAVSQGMPLSGRLAVHRALAAALDGPGDVDRRAWHLASAAVGPDEQVAAELEHTAVRAGKRSGHAAAAAAYERAGRLTVDPEAKARRLTLAAEAACDLGDFDRARALAEEVVPAADDAMLRSRLLNLRAAASFGKGALRSAHELLCAGVDLIVAIDTPLARGTVTEMLFLAWHISWQVGDSALIGDTADRLEALTIPAADPLASVHKLLLWLTYLPLGRSVAELPPLSVLTAGVHRIRLDEPCGGIILTGSASLAVGADSDAEELAATLAASLRDEGRIGLLSPALTYLAITQFMFGRYRDAEASASEAVQIAEDTGQPGWAGQANSVLMNIAAIRGDDQGCRAAAEAAFGAASNQDALVAAGALWGLSMLDLGYGRPEAALHRLEELAGSAMWYRLSVIRSTPDLVEAAVRVGEPARATESLARFENWAAHARQPWIDALVQRCKALLANDSSADDHYRAALELHEANRPMERARTQLLYGEWLRRARRTVEARIQLRSALETFDRIGAAPWADRARSELDASGAAVPNSRPPGVLAGLTPQELQVVRLAGRGMSNRDIAAQLFLSPRTIGHHLYKAYPKLGVTSRTELSALPLTD